MTTPFQIIYTKPYIKHAKRFIKRHPHMLSQYEKTLKLLELNPFHPALRLHALKGHLTGLHSISINLQYRISIDLMIDGNKIMLIKIGDHNFVYQ